MRRKGLVPNMNLLCASSKSVRFLVEKFNYRNDAGGGECALRKRSIVQTAILVLLLFIPAIAQNKSERLDPDGSFWLIVDPPNDFSEFSAITLNAKKLRRLPPPGLQTIKGTNFAYKTLTVKRNNFTFTTVARGGVSYSFSGKFLRGGIFAVTELDDMEPVLEGTLTKFRGGKKVAEAKLKLSYFGGT